MSQWSLRNCHRANLGSVSDIRHTLYAPQLQHGECTLLKSRRAESLVFQVEPLEDRCMLDGTAATDALQLFNTLPALLIENQGFFFLDSYP